MSAADLTLAERKSLREKLQAAQSQMDGGMGTAEKWRGYGRPDEVLRSLSIAVEGAKRVVDIGKLLECWGTYHAQECRCLAPVIPAKESAST